MLLLNLATIRSPHQRFEEVYPPAGFAADGETFTVAAPVTLQIEIDKDKDQFRLVGRVRTTLDLLCGRCLEPFTLPVDASFDLRYQPRATASGETEREIQEDDFSTAFYDDETIDLGQLMHEQFYLSVPMKPLCTDHCRGLCVQCGTNLNKGACNCTQDWEDPRLAALKALRDTLQKNH